MSIRGDSRGGTNLPFLPEERTLMRVSWADKHAFGILLGPALLVLILLSIIPFIHVLYISFHTWELTKPWLGRPFIGLDNFRAFVHSAQVWESLRITVIFTVMSVGISMIIGFLLALLLNQQFRGQAVFRSLFLIPMMITPVVIGLSWRFMLDPTFGVLNYLLSRIGVPAQAWLTDPRLVLPTIVAVDVWQWIPLIMLIVLAGLQAMPQAPFEAAQMDGASDWMIFRRITLPFLRPVILIALLLRTMDAIRTFDTTYIMTGGGPGRMTELASIHLYRKGLKYFHIGDASAYALVVLATIMLASFLYIKIIEREAGADEKGC